LSNQQNQYQPNRYDELCYALFEHDERAKELLGILVDSLLINTAVADPDKSERHDCYREGQNSIVRSFKHGASKHKLYLQFLAEQEAKEKAEKGE